MTTVAAGPPPTTGRGQGRTGVSADDIRDLLPHRWPMLLVDRLESLEPGIRAVGIKSISGSEPWFQGHFPERAVLPGVIALEALAQVAGIVAGSEPRPAGTSVPASPAISYLTVVRSVRFRRTMVPGDQVRLSAERTAGTRLLGEYRVRASVEGTTAVEGQLSIAEPTADSARRPR